MVTSLQVCNYSSPRREVHHHGLLMEGYSRKQAFIMSMVQRITENRPRKEASALLLWSALVSCSDRNRQGVNAASRPCYIHNSIQKSALDVHTVYTVLSLRWKGRLEIEGSLCGHSLAVRPDALMQNRLDRSKNKSHTPSAQAMSYILVHHQQCSFLKTVLKVQNSGTEQSRG